MDYAISDKTTIKNIETNITKECDILKKNDSFLELVIVGTTIKLKLIKKNSVYVGKYKEMEFVSTGN